MVMGQPVWNGPSPLRRGYLSKERILKAGEAGPTCVDFSDDQNMA